MNAILELTAKHRSILHHTIYRAAGGRYCGGGEAMDELVAAGLMRYLGTPEWAPDPFYEITREGRTALQAWEETQPKPPPSKKLTRSQQRYREYWRSESSLSFPEWLGIQRRRS